MKCDVMVVDPPWAYGRDTGRPNRTAESHYDTLGHKGREINRHTGAGIEAIINTTPIMQWASDNAHLFLWTTNPKLPFAFEIMRAWGFTYKTTITWIKTRADGGIHGGGMGWFFRGATEHVLFGVKGRKPIASGLRVPNVVRAPPTKHSVKPDAFYKMVEGLYEEPQRMIDVYARGPRAGWCVWGNEISGLEKLKEEKSQ